MGMSLLDLIEHYRALDDPDDIELATLRELEEYLVFGRHHAEVERQVLELRGQANAARH